MKAVEVPNEAVGELPDFSRHGKLLVLICSSHKNTLVLKRAWQPDLLVNQSGRSKRDA